MKKKNLKIKFVPYEKYRRDGMKAIMKDLKQETIVLIDAKLPAEEEAKIIEETMKKINGNSNSFTGIELSSIDFSGKTSNSLEWLKNVLIQTIIGKKRGMTIIGPAKIVRRIDKNPEELLLYT
jgi:hypothetical protein